MTSEYKIYLVKGYFYKPQLKEKFPMKMEVRAKNEAQVLERVYAEIGSRHKVKRNEIFIPKDGGIVEISPEESTFPIFSQVQEEDFVIYKE